MRISDWSSDVCSSDLLPSIEGLADFKGKIFLNSRWDYDYTGGAPDNPQLTNLRDKRVAIVGTGCSAVQAIPPLAEGAKELYVFKRTPSMVQIHRKITNRSEERRVRARGVSTG